MSECRIVTQPLLTMVNARAIIQKCKNKKLDFLMITDNNINCDTFLEVDGLTHIYGAEFSKKDGH